MTTRDVVLHRLHHPPITKSPPRLSINNAAQMSFIQRVGSATPQDYVTPDFPSLYWPLPLRAATPYYLYHPGDIWRFTTYWTLLFFAAVHVVVSLWACIIQFRNWKIIWIVPIVYLLVGAIEGLIAGSIVGGLLGGVYQSGYFKMSTWIPFVWALVNALVLILSSFAIHGGL